MRMLLCFACAFACQCSAFDKHPSPEFGPKEVLEIVLAGMASNDTPTLDAGLHQAFRFASPGNKAVVGPFWHFKAMVKQPTYAPLLYHIKRTLGEPVTIASNSTIPIIVISTSGEVAGYMWTLTMQADGEHKGSWMTESVRRVSLGEDLKAL